MSRLRGHAVSGSFQLTFRVDVAFRDVTVNKGAEDVEDRYTHTEYLQIPCMAKYYDKY